MVVSRAAWSECPRRALLRAIRTHARSVATGHVRVTAYPAGAAGRLVVATERGLATLAVLRSEVL